MSIGKMARRILGPRLFAVAGRYYRAIFVDLEQVADVLAAHVPDRARVLDVGGGDGALLNFLLDRRPDLHVTMIDLSANIGRSIETRHLERVERLPGTSIRQYLEEGRPAPDCVLLSDVVHHVPAAMRPQFFRDLADVLSRPGVRLIIKDVEPGSPRAVLSLLADRYISGDRDVELVAAARMKEAVRAALGPVEVVETDLLDRDRPNYALVFVRT